MLCNSYQKFLFRLQRVKEELDSLFDEGLKESKNFENIAAGPIIENVLENIGLAVFKLERLSARSIEGVLQEDPERKKFELFRKDTGEGIGWFLSCGAYLEVYDHETCEWYAGRVEHTRRGDQEGYYFVCHDLEDPFLYSGMIARVRDV